VKKSKEERTLLKEKRKEEMEEPYEGRLTRAVSMRGKRKKRGKSVSGCFSLMREEERGCYFARARKERGKNAVLIYRRKKKKGLGYFHRRWRGKPLSQPQTP